jgi:RHS repeat-associated protein
VDGLGNYLDHQRVDQTVRRWNQVYDSSGTLLYLGAQSLGGGSAFQDTTRYDYIGQGSVFHIDTYAGFNLLTFRFQHTKLTNAYRADNLLMAAETTIDSTSTTTSNGPLLYTEHEEYRYDALGRRIWVRSLHGATCQTWYPNGDCASALKREVWDGAALIYESRYPGDVNLPSGNLEQETGAAGGSFAARFGRVAYLNGGDLDHPLAEIKMDGAASTATFAPRYNWRGLAEEAVCSAGQSCGTQYFGASAVSAYYEQVPAPNGPPAWSGSLIEGSRDASGLVYKRNRYYDPASGKFTSQDPLGLGGGLNVYGFAGGDPVNGDDPFGLCPTCLIDLGAQIQQLVSQQEDETKNRVGLTMAVALLSEWVTHSNTPPAMNPPADESEAEEPAANPLATDAEVEKETVVIGKMTDLRKSGTIRQGERTLEGQLTPDLLSDEANWARNEKVLLAEMAKGKPIRDASVDFWTGGLRDNTGFLARERDLLQANGWTYNPTTTMWTK